MATTLHIGPDHFYYTNKWWIMWVTDPESEYYLQILDWATEAQTGEIGLPVGRNVLLADTQEEINTYVSANGLTYYQPMLLQKQAELAAKLAAQKASQ